MKATTSWGPPTAALLVVVGCSAAAVTAAFVPWRKPAQIPTFPWVSDIPPRLLTAFVLVAVAGVVIAVGAARRLAPTAAKGRAGVLLLLVLVASATVEAWTNLYVTATADPVIQLTMPLEFAVPAGMVAVTAGFTSGRGERLAAGALALLPVSTLTVLGDAIDNRQPSGAFWSVLTWGVPGAVFGLAVGAAAKTGIQR